MSARFVIGNTVAVLGCMTMVGAAFWPIYQSLAFVVMVAITAVVGAAIAVVGAVYRLPAHLVALSGVGAFIVLGVPLAVPSGAVNGIFPTLGGLRDLALGVALAWKRLLTITLPVGSYEALLVPAYIVVLLTTIVSLSIALRARYGQLAAIGPVVAFLVANIFGSGSTFYPLVVALGLGAIVLLWMNGFRWRRGRASVRRLIQSSGAADRRVEDATQGVARALTGAALIVAVAAAGAAGISRIAEPTGPREVLRTSVAQPFDPSSYPSPLSTFRRYLTEPTASETMLTVSGLPAGERLRIATLDSYDGVVYSVGSSEVTSASGAFTLVPYTFDQSDVAGEPVAVDITVGGYSGVWLPTAGQLESITFAGSDAARLRGSFYYNDNSGSAAVIGGVDQGDSYRLTAVLPAGPADLDLSDLEPGDADVPNLDPIPDGLALALDRWVGTASAPGDQLVAAIAGMRAEGYVSHGFDSGAPSRSGHSANRITELVSDPRMIGDGEQYAVTAALAAHALGFPARVVVGFAPDGDAALSDVTGANIAAWIEVNTRQYGWVTLDPTPEPREIPDAEPEVPTTIARPQTPVQPPDDLPPPPEDQLPPETEQQDPTSTDPLLAALLVAMQITGWTMLALAVLASPFVAIAATKIRRRRARRRANTPVARIHGGWAEFQDAVADHGLTAPPSPTRREFAAVVPGATSEMLAAAADRASFAPNAPDSTDADWVWGTVDELLTMLDAGLTRRQRFGATVSLQSLRPSRGVGGSRRISDTDLPVGDDR